MRQSIQTILARSVWCAATLLVCVTAHASHTPAPISDIDGVVISNPQVFSGAYTQSATDHPWFVFNGTVGSMIEVSLVTTFGAGTSNRGSYLWLLDVLDNMPEVGDSTANGQLSLLAQSDNNDTDLFLNQSISFMLGSSGVFAVQIDSWLGGSGNYELTIRGANVASVPEPGTLALVGLAMAGLAAVARRPRVGS